MRTAPPHTPPTPPAPAEKKKASGTEKHSSERKSGLVVRIFLIAAIVCVLMIPTVIAVTDYWLHRDSPATERTTEYLSAMLSGPSGKELHISPEDENGLLPLFTSIIESGVRSTRPELASTYRLQMTGSNGTEDYRFYCHTETGILYFEDSNGNCFRATPEHAAIFLNSPYTNELYESSRIPLLTTAATDEIIPAEVQWFYRTQNKSYTERVDAEVSSEWLVYPIANDIGFTFSVMPDHYTVTIIQNGVQTVYQNQNTFTTPQLTESERLEVQIHAEYRERVDADYYGTLSYRFYMNVVEAAQFSPATTTLTEGSYLMLACKNVKNEQKLQISLQPASGGAPVIFKRGETVYAAIPAGSAGEKTLSVTYGTISSTFELTVLQNRLAADIIKPPEALHGDWVTLLSGGLDALIQSKGAAEVTGTLTPSGVFADYTEGGTERLVSFGDFITGPEGKQALPFEIYRTQRTIAALAAGAVKETGFDMLLGNYIILDHGCGLYTWYCGLSEVRTTKGSIVAKGEEIGVTGKTGIGFTEGDDVLILTTLGKTAISPETLRRTPYL